MASKGDWAEGATLQWLLGAGGVSPTRPTSRKIALYTVDPNEAGAGATEISTGNWTNYAQVAATFGAVSGTSPTQCANDAIVDFGTAVVPGANVSVVGFTVLDQAGNLIYGPYAFATPVVVQNGNPVSFPIGSLVVTED